ncbi:MAG: SpoIIE family protein phosphatase [Ignavibacteria bacterium]|nr:SpoIIE family protein phosphatase [Ignavibacteria bacterium]
MDAARVTHKFLFRLIIIAVTVVFLGLNSILVYQFSKTVVTGAQYRGIPGKFFFKKDITTANLANPASNLFPKTGDILLSVNGIILHSESQFDSLLRNLQGKTCKIEYYDLYSIRNSIGDENNIKLDSKPHSLNIPTELLSKNTLRYVAHGTLISHIDRNGAVARGGLLPGDVIITVNGTQLITMDSLENQPLSMESIRFLRDRPAGSILTYQVLRNNIIYHLRVELASFGFSFLVLGLISIAFIFYLVGLFFTLKRPHLFVARITGTAFIMMGYLLCNSIEFYPVGYNLYTIIRSLIQNLALAFVFPVFFHSFAYFPIEITRITRNKWYFRIPYSISAVTALLMYAQILNLTTSSWVGNAIVVLLLGNLFSFFILRYRNRSEFSKEYKKLALPIKVSFSIVSAMLLVQILAQLLNLNYSNTIGIVLSFSLTIIPFSYLFITWKYRLLDIDLRIRTNTLYNIVLSSFYIGMIAFFVLGLVRIASVNINFPNIRYTGTSLEILNHQLAPELNSFYLKLFCLVTGLLFSYLVFRVFYNIKNVIDRKFYRQRLDYRYVLDELVSLLENTRELLPLLRLIAEGTAEVLHLKSTGITIFRKNKLGLGNEIFVFNHVTQTHVELQPGLSLYEAIEPFSNAISIDYLPDEFKEYFRGNGVQKIIPIKQHDALVAALFIGEKRSETYLTTQDIDILHSLVKNFAVAIENACLYEDLADQQRYKQELAIARKIQLSSLPQKLPEYPQLQVAAASLPALEVGGDFYDFLNGSVTDLTVILGDVSGKGTSAALYMSKVQGIFKTLHAFYNDPYDLVDKVNSSLFRQMDSKSFITAGVATFSLDSKIVSYARAGHLPLLHYKASENSIERIVPRGIGLGIGPLQVFANTLEISRISYHTDDVFILYSDGITEAKNSTGNFYGEDKLEQIISEYAAMNADIICKSIIADVQLFAKKTEQSDDITLVVVKIN